MGTFALQIAAWVAKTKEDTDQVVRRVLQEVGDELILRSPVGDKEKWAENIERKERGLPALPPGYVGGRFKGNWQLGVDEPVTDTLPDIDPSGAASKARMMAAIPPQAAGRHYFITNNLPYAQRLEDGWSKQAPSGMVALTVVRYQAIVDGIVASLK
ncbi:hypothetical protein [Rugamonas sp.]|uniref:hypothetical protein n=1 Tax=Rugamonas sp. TaxID=1926287 RepID=UPI0025EB9A52|nr:hypothetical protein [Rugamonas sp.]